jgi:hypothetical protein
MNAQRRVVVLGGSPKGDKSISESLGDYLVSRLTDNGWTADKVRVHEAMKTEEGRAHLHTSVADADLVVLVFPNYVDSLPAPVIAAAEMLAQTRRKTPAAKAQQLLAIVTSGFPESQQSATALAICRRFAAETGFAWAGGLALGGSGAIAGKPLREAGPVARNITKALDMAAVALNAGNPVPPEAAALMGKLLVPTPLYIWMGNRGLLRRAKEHGAEKNLYDRPFAA